MKNESIIFSIQLRTKYPNSIIFFLLQLEIFLQIYEIVISSLREGVSKKEREREKERKREREREKERERAATYVFFRTAMSRSYGT